MNVVDHPVVVSSGAAGGPLLRENGRLFTVFGASL